MKRREAYNPNWLIALLEDCGAESVYPDSDFHARGGSPPDVRNFVYFIQSGGAKGPIKIGEGWNPPLRLRSFQIGNPKPLRLLAVICDSSETLEGILHDALSLAHIRGEWFIATNDLLDAIAWLQRKAGP